MREHGPGTLSTVELLAIVLAKGTADDQAAMPDARDCIRKAGGVRALVKLDSALLRNAGMDDFAIVKFVAGMELGRRTLEAGNERTAISKPEDAAEIYKYLRGEEKEHFCGIFLNAKNEVVHHAVIHIGTVTASMVGIKEFFREAVREGAVAAIAVHNHPSGDPTPSKEDFEVTKVLFQAGKLLDIPLLDHIIIGEPDFRSLQEMGAIG